MAGNIKLIKAVFESLMEKDACVGYARKDDGRVVPIHAGTVLGVLDHYEDVLGHLAAAEKRAEEAERLLRECTEANQSAAVCQNHIAEFTADTCLVCDLEAAEAERDRLREFVEIVATSVEMYGADPLWLAEDGKRLGVWFEVSGADEPIRIELPWKRGEATDGE